MGIFERFPKEGCISPKRDLHIFCESAVPWLAQMQVHIYIPVLIDRLSGVKLARSGPPHNTANVCFTCL
jgi:hypothetical protein